jgi:hypothetical protein
MSSAPIHSRWLAGIALALLVFAVRPALSATWASANDVKGFGTVPMSLIHAIEMARKTASEQHQPDRPIQARYDSRGAQYRVLLVSQDKVVEARVPVDPKNGSVVLQAPEPIARLKQDDPDLTTQLPPKGIDLETAAANADEFSGAAIDAGLVASKGGASYRVDVAHDGKLLRIDVDPTSGKAQPAG